MKILVIFTGGTIGSTESGGIISPNAAGKRALLNDYDNKYNITFEQAEPYYALSENNTGVQLTQLIQCVHENLNSCDGIIIAHGTDTLQYSACALSFACGTNTVPIVLVSANHPLTDSRSNGRDNFSNAVDFIRGKSGRGVFICYKNSCGTVYIHRGSRVLAHREFEDNLFSIKNQYYGIMKNGSFIKNESYTAQKDEIQPFGCVSLSAHSDIKTIHTAVGEDFKYDSSKPCLIKAYHSGTLPTDDKSFLSFAGANKNIFLSGFHKKNVYESAAGYQALGLHILPVSTFISSYIKLWMASSLNLPLDEIMQKSLGEDIVQYA